MNLQTKRLRITPLQMDMAQRLHEMSLDENNRRFVPDEVFETAEEAAEVIAYLSACVRNEQGPQVYAVTLHDGTLIGHVQASPIRDGWEIGYHIGQPYTECGYATEAVQAFLPFILPKLGLREIWGICLADNAASIRVLQKCGFQKTWEGIDAYQGQPELVFQYLYQIR